MRKRCCLAVPCGTPGTSLGGGQAGAARVNLLQVIYSGYPKLAA